MPKIHEHDGKRAQAFGIIEKGRVLWTRAGLDELVSYADLSKYTIELKSSKFKADSVEYLNKKYFDYLVKGSL